ncbi:MAG TPA: apolipoprotein N-acyltransferase [Terracidiphilus sp.]|nr:apolipoprotein N-acyltransferase [Terracidiphilus sp.]
MAPTAKSQPAQVPAGRASSPISSWRLPLLFACVSAVLLDFCFPVAGPLPPARAALAWVALVPLLWALLNDGAAAHPRYLRRATLTAYACGVLWYILNCYWIYQTMLFYGHVPPLGSAGIVVLFSAILGLYFAVFGFLTAFFRRRFGLVPALVLAPFLWSALELAAARITSVPWDQLGYSQVDNLWLTRLAPVTGVYGLSFVLVGVNAMIAVAALRWKAMRRRAGVPAVLGAIGIFIALFSMIPLGASPSPTSAYAVLLQPNIQVAADAGWTGNEWFGNLSWLLQQSTRTCTPAFRGMPRSGVTPPGGDCAQNTPPPGVILWPETASWFQSDQPRTLQAMHLLATTTRAPIIAGMAGPQGDYNSALFVQPDGSIAGRYDKIHLVPFGEYIPDRNLFFFAKSLTHQLVDLQRGAQRNVFTASTSSGPHAFGTFICYESIFADEVRQFTLHGAQVLVNLSDDGWYGDTSAPWQHLNMSRMRAIENHRWLLLDTNSGVTTVIDPDGRVTFSAPRHQLTALIARYGYETNLTFYTRFGDLFAYLCCVVVILALGAAVARRPRATSPKL